MGTWDPSVRVHAWGRGAFLLLGVVKARLAEQLAEPEGIATLDGAGAAPWPLKSLILSAWFRALGAARTQTSQAASTQDPLEPAPGLPERPGGRPGARLTPDGGDAGHWPRRRASREKEERPFRGGRVLAGIRQIPADGKSWYPLTHLGPPSPTVHGTFYKRPLPPPVADHGARARCAQPPGLVRLFPPVQSKSAQVGYLSEPDRRGQCRTQIPLSFGIASLTFKFREKKGRTIRTKRRGLRNR